MNQWAQGEHGKHHIITIRWCKLLINARETTDDVNGSQGTQVQFVWCEYMSWYWTPHTIFQSKDFDVKLSPRAKKLSINVCKHQGTMGFSKSNSWIMCSCR